MNLLSLPLANAFFHFETGLGYETLSYNEVHSSQPALDVELAENLIVPYVILRFPILSRWINIESSGKFHSVLTSSDSSKKMSYTEYSSSLIYTIHSMPFRINVTAEYFADEPSPSDSTFGYEKLDGVRFAFFTDLDVPFTGMELHLYYPFWTQINGLTQYKISGRWVLGGNGPPKRGEHSFYRTGTIFEISYEYKKLEFTKLLRPIDISTASITASLGIAW